MTSFGELTNFLIIQQITQYLGLVFLTGGLIFQVS